MLADLFIYMWVHPECLYACVFYKEICLYNEHEASVAESSVSRHTASILFLSPLGGIIYYVLYLSLSLFLSTNNVMQNVENLLREYIINAILSHLLEQPAAASYANFNWFSATLIGVRVLARANLLYMYVSSSEMRRLLDKYVRARRKRVLDFYSFACLNYCVMRNTSFMHTLRVEERNGRVGSRIAQKISCSSWLRMLTINVWRCRQLAVAFA